ncbi:hypothetical protein [Jiangella asiatica]|uniref:Uncharacterized protein n=1 Tax=Jiangella asiatica TaxID=2530372 RepID=A0A4V2Z0B5_9ACTN|nr:hypothetical protein [Jiangella asiatica]TDE00318.1 hypothetical protein E1269_25680 [Jiangella asiatica]
MVVSDGGRADAGAGARAAGAGGAGGIRRAVEELLRVEAEVSRLVDGAARDAGRQGARVADVLRQARHPPVRNTADEVAGLSATLPGAIEPIAQTSSAALATEVHALLGLLAVDHHHLDPLPPLNTGAPRTSGGMAGAFPEGFARDYVQTVLDDLRRGRATTKDQAGAHPDADQALVDAARGAIVAAVSPQHRRQVDDWLSHPDCHAVELHGPQVSDRELELRAGWTRPPDRGIGNADPWRLRDDGKVVSKHRAGTEATRFTSAEAFARPLEMFLDIADRHPGGLEHLLDENFPAGIAPVFIDAASAGVRPDDLTGFRGTGTGTAAAAKDWRKMRTAAMKKEGECLPPVRTVAYDPTVEGSVPGVRLIFTRNAEGWVMTTYYPAGEPSYDNVRLEELT